MAGQVECEHKRTWIGSDDFIERVVPGFFDAHNHSTTKSEWQVCQDCGHARLVKHVAVFNNQITYEDNLPRMSRYSQELMERAEKQK